MSSTAPFPPLPPPSLQGLEAASVLHSSEMEGMVMARSNEEVLRYLAKFYAV